MPIVHNPGDFEGWDLDAEEHALYVRGNRGVQIGILTAAICSALAASGIFTIAILQLAKSQDQTPDYSLPLLFCMPFGLVFGGYITFRTAQASLRALLKFMDPGCAETWTRLALFLGVLLATILNAVLAILLLGIMV